MLAFCCEPEFHLQFVDLGLELVHQVFEVEVGNCPLSLAGVRWVTVPCPLQVCEVGNCPLSCAGV